MTAAERQRLRRERLRQAEPAKPAAPTPAELAEAQAEIERLREQLQAKIIFAQNTEIELSYEKTIARLEKLLKAKQTRIRNLEQILDLHQRTSVASVMSRETSNKIAKALHSDRKPSEAEREDALMAFNAWKDRAKKVR